VRAAALRKGRHGKREQSDCGAELHEAILRPIEILFLGRQGGRFWLMNVPARFCRNLRFVCAREWWFAKSAALGDSQMG